MSNLYNLVRIFMYVNPSTQKAEKVMMYTPFGVSERIDSEWERTNRAKSGIDDLSEDKVYELDWDTDFVPMDSEEEDTPHAAVLLYDKDNLTEEDCKKYGFIHIDPNDDSNPELDKLLEEYNGTIND